MRYPDALTLLQVVPQIFLVMDIVMTVTIHLKAILMVGTAVRLIMYQIGINIVPNVNVLSLQQLQQQQQQQQLQQQQQQRQQ